MREFDQKFKRHIFNDNRVQGNKPSGARQQAARLEAREMRPPAYVSQLSGVVIHIR
jgi:hypothetical protein